MHIPGQWGGVQEKGRRSREILPQPAVNAKPVIDELWEEANEAGEEFASMWEDNQTRVAD